MMPIFVQIPLILVLFSFGIAILGTAFMPALLWFFWALGQTTTWEPLSRAWAMGLSLGLAYLIFGFSLIAVAVIITRILPKMKPGEYKFASAQGAQWFFTGALSFLVSKFFLDFLLLTGVNVIYFRLMGAKIGKNCQINTKNISDFHLITIGDNSMIGGQSTILGHVGERGKLKLRPVNIGSRVTVGLGAIIFPGVEIGDRAVVGAGSLVLKDEKIPPNSVYIGVPAKNIRTRS
jgi:hypothetical protein